MSTIFITYRRSDSAGFTGHLRSRLDAHYGAESVFQDISDIPAGEEFDKAIEASLGVAKVQLVVIGKDWLNAKDRAGNRRLDQPGDYVAREIEMGLTRGIRVIPILVDDPTLMPPADQLPERIRGLTMKNAPTIREARFDDDVDALIKQLGPLGTRVLGLRRRTAVLAAGLAASLAVLGLVAARPGAPKKMRELAFNVAVTEFSELTNNKLQRSDVGKELGNEIAKSIKQKVSKPDALVEVWGPSQAGRLLGADDQERAKNALALAQRINADVALYGVVVTEEGRSYLRTGYVLTGKTLALAGRDLVGPYQLDDSEEFRSVSDRGSLQSLQTVLAKQGSVLAGLVAALDSYANGRFAAAKQQFALLAESWPSNDRAGQKTLALYQGLTDARLQDFAAAKDHYQRALTIDPAFGRAEIALAEAEFQLGKGNCSDPSMIDQTAIGVSLESFQLGGSRPDPGKLGNLAAKAAFGQGRVHSCLVFARLAESAAAKSHYAEVLQAFASVAPDDEVQRASLASITAASHADLGLLAAYIDNDLKRGAAELLEASKLSKAFFDPNYSLYTANLACVYLKQDDPERATASYEAALSSLRRNRDKNPAVIDRTIARIEKELATKTC